MGGKVVAAQKETRASPSLGWPQHERPVTISVPCTLGPSLDISDRTCVCCDVRWQRRRRRSLHRMSMSGARTADATTGRSVAGARGAAEAESAGHIDAHEWSLQYASVRFKLSRPPQFAAAERCDMQERRV